MIARPRITRARVAWLVAGLVFAPIVALIAGAALTPFPADLLETPSPSVRVEDSSGALLREVRASDGKRARVLDESEIGETLEHAILAAEDRRFYDHRGVDTLAMVRAVATDIVHARIVSGGSTLTMQLARTVRPHPRTLVGKLREMALALRIEWTLPKKRIFELYANDVDFGPNVRGVGAASLAMFGKPPRALSIAEAALLAGLPRGPSAYALGKRTALVHARRDRVLVRMADDGWLSDDELRRATQEPIGLDPDRAAFGAPHFVDAVLRLDLADLRGASRIETTLDGDLQRAATLATATTIGVLSDRHVTAGAVVVLDNRTGDVLAYVGSPDAFDASRLGANDGARALRQPGSALKPFLYALAIERLGFTAATVLPDVELRVESDDGADFEPLDYDGHFHGPVRLRDALGGSLNVPAVWTLAHLGVAPFLDRLHALGFASLARSPEDYGTALALGDGEVTLVELANAYATLARGGIHRAPRFVRAVTLATGERRTLDVAAPARVMSDETVAQITDVLADPRARVASFGEGEALRFPFDVAAKTGTSKGYRDNWAVAYSDAVTVAAWVGNFDGTPMSHVSGITGAGPLMHAVMMAAMRSRAPGALTRPGTLARASSAPAPRFDRVEVCVLSGQRPGHDCHHRVAEWLPHARAASLETCTMHVRVDIDRRNGLRAGPGCDPSHVDHVAFEELPTEYDAWAERASRRSPPRAYSPLCPAATLTASVRIDSPRDGDAFLLDPDRLSRLQAIDVRVAAPDGARDVQVRIDGAPVATLTAPYVLSWPLVAGPHEIVALAAGVASEPVRVRVE
jgi:penicillin-binding protein 1C